MSHSRSNLSSIRRDLRRCATSARAEISKGYFKTGPGQYGEGDRFIGCTLPDIRRLAKTYQDLPRGDLLRLLRSPWHEERQVALFILVRQYQRATRRRDRQAIYGLYLRHTRHINNWDLVDGTAEFIVGAHLHLYGPDRNRLRRLAASKLLWDRRIAVLATFHQIKHGQFQDALMVAELLLEDDHDLIHKAVGWMLREIGKRDRGVEERFLRRHAARMPRTMLRYAIERFPESLRGAYLRRR